MQAHSKQTFFLPRIYKQYPSVAGAECFNLVHRLLNRAQSDYVFIPIRSMQYLAVIDGNEIWFVDSQAYAVKGKEGGRLITVSWRTLPDVERDSLNQSIPMDVIFYARDMKDIQLRLTGEFYQAMQLIDQRYREQQIPAEGARIIELQQKS